MNLCHHFSCSFWGHLKMDIFLQKRDENALGVVCVPHISHQDLKYILNRKLMVKYEILPANTMQNIPCKYFAKYYLQILCMHNSHISGSNEGFCSPILIKPVVIMFFNKSCMIDLFRLYVLILSFPIIFISIWYNLCWLNQNECQFFYFSKSNTSMESVCLSKGRISNVVALYAWPILSGIDYWISQGSRSSRGCVVLSEFRNFITGIQTDQTIFLMLTLLGPKW